MPASSCCEIVLLRRRGATSGVPVKRSIASGGGCPVSVDTLPPGAELYVNGDLAGKTPCVVVLPPGEHTLNARRDGFKGTRLFVKVKPGETEPKRKLITLDREGAPGP